MSRRNRPATWGPAALPDMRRSAVETLRLENAAPSSALGSLSASDLAVSEEWRGRIASHLDMAELFWVTRDMTRAALDASRDMPPWVPAEIAPSPYGIVIWDTDLPALPGSVTSALTTSRWGGQGMRRLGGVMWSTYGGAVHVRTLITSRSGTPALAADIIEWSLPATEPITDDIDGSRLAVSYLLAATWVLMMTPTVATAIPSTPDGRDARLRARMGELPARITTIDLRPLRTVPPEGVEVPEGGGREYRHRWVVRGHWRNQAHGPGRSLHRPVWVPSYIKGPGGAPLLAREHVYVRRR